MRAEPVHARAARAMTALPVGEVSVPPRLSAPAGPSTRGTPWSGAANGCALSPEEMEFLAEEERVTIVPLFHSPRLQLLSGAVGPFRAQVCAPPVSPSLASCWAGPGWSAASLRYARLALPAVALNGCFASPDPCAGAPVGSACAESQGEGEYCGAAVDGGGGAGGDAGV